MNNNNNFNKRRFYYANIKGKGGHYGFNCWGATLFVLGQAKRLEWVTCGTMDRFLENKTKPVAIWEIGDILVIRDGRWLEHTAVYIGGGLYFHKRGPNTSEVTDIKGVRKIYGGDVREHRRLII